MLGKSGGFIALSADGLKACNGFIDLRSAVRIGIHHALHLKHRNISLVTLVGWTCALDSAKGLLRI
jgi:hypothetical protein